jgi:hypothetical protein
MIEMILLKEIKREDFHKKTLNYSIRADSVQNAVCPY